MFVIAKFLFFFELKFFLLIACEHKNCTKLFVIHTFPDFTVLLPGAFVAPSH